ncbi:MAG: restriction endonuclease subunit S, partial [Alistipes sp.]
MGNVPHLRFPEFSGEWEIYPLTDFMSFKNGMNPDAKRFGRGTKFISVMDILNNQFICYDNIRASVEVVDGDIETYGVNYGDILFQRSSETLEDVGQANVYLDSKPAVFGGFVIRGKSKSNYYPMFFRYLLASPTARKKIIVKGAGAQHFNIGQDGLSKVCLNIPSIQEQEKIAKLFECIDTRIATQNKIIEKLQSLIKGLSQQLLSSENDWILYRLDDLAQIKSGYS